MIRKSKSATVLIALIIFIVSSDVCGDPFVEDCKIDRRMPTGAHYLKINSVSNSSPGAIGIIGDVRVVLQGIVTESTRSTYWTGATTGPVGFGTGTVGPLDAVGEAVYLNGKAFIRSTDNGTRDYFRTVTGYAFRAQYSAFITHGAVRDGLFMINFRGTGKNISLSDLYSEIYEAVGQRPFCFYGLTQFAQLDGIAISKAPVNGEPLFEEDGSSSYYSMPNFGLPNEFGFMAGCAANFGQIRDPELIEKLSRNLYVNPQDGGGGGGNGGGTESSELTTHSHALGLNRCLNFKEEIDAGVVSGVYHMLSSATIRSAKLSVFVVDGNESLVELSPFN